MQSARSPWRSASSRGIAATLAVLVVFTIKPARSAPGDIFTQAAPVIGTDPPKAADLKTGDASVSTQTGALEFSYPIGVPPGRNGMAPKISLAYSSQGAIYGGIASGWSMPIPMITEDFSVGRLQTRSPEVEANEAVNNLDSRLDDRFVSSLAGGQRLVMVNEPWTPAAGVYGQYRAQHDSSFARYERMQTNEAFRWRVRTTDGTTLLFGKSDVTGEGTHACAAMISDQYAPMTHMTDAFGNEVRYDYEIGEPYECRIKQIVWGQNTNAGLSSFAKVAFNWAKGVACDTNPPIFPGTQTDYRTGIPIVTGASKLMTIVATAFSPFGNGIPEHTRQVTLQYNDGTNGTPNSESCTQNRSPLRQLAWIKESAWGTDAPLVELPPVTFSYNATTLLTQHSTSAPAWGDTAPALAWGYRYSDDRWPTVEAMLQDIDGDGLLDRVTNASNGSTCQAAWTRNNGNGTWGTGGTITLPRLKWRGNPAGESPVGASAAYHANGQQAEYEHCALNGQATAFHNSVGTPGLCHVPSGSSPMACSGPFDCPNGTRCPLDTSSPSGSDYRTYLAYRWLDMDSDGLVDLVAAVHGSIDWYDIDRGNRVNAQDDYTGGEPSMFGLPGHADWPACPTGFDRCVDLGPLRDMRTCSGGACTIRWDLINETVLGQPQKPCFSVMARPAGDGGGSSYTPGRTPYTRCGGLYPWFIFKNNGNGSFASTAVIKYQPIPLESDQGDSAMQGPTASGQHYAVMDFDGDGILDAVAHGKIWAQSNPDAIFVWLGDGTGGFHPKRYTFPTRARGAQEDDNAISGAGTVSNSVVESRLGLLDVNGDSLPDHWLASSGTTNLAFNDGTQQRIVPGGIGERSLAVKPGNDATLAGLTPYPGFPISGTSAARWRTVDLDNDGRVDVVDASSTIAYWNVGGQFLTGHNYLSTTGSNDGPLRRTKASAGGTTTDPYIWELKSDLVDLDGNGVPENISFADNATFHRYTESPGSQPHRLLSQIDNGRGARTNITYASMHDTTTVEQASNQAWFDGRPKASPRSQWVVKSLTTIDDFPTQTSATTSYRYKNPRFGADSDQRYAFRGFEEVTTTAPGATGSADGAKTIQRYDYEVDPTGRLFETLVAPGAADAPIAGEVRSIQRTDWAEKPLFGGAVKTYVALETQQFTCANGQTEATCAASAPGYTRTTSSFTAYPTPMNPGLWLESTTLLQSGTSAAEGDRQTTITYQLDADPTKYLLHPSLVLKEHRESGVMTTYAKSRATFDTSDGALLKTEVWVDSVDGNRSITQYQTDHQTGNRLQVTDPRNKVTSYEYDGRKLFVAAVNSPIYVHDVEYTWEYGTGAKLVTNGPLWAQCAVHYVPYCPPADPPLLLRSQDKIRVDGLGRPLERWESVTKDPNLLDFELKKTEIHSYIDAPSGSTPASSTHSRAIDETSGVIRYAESRTELDGHGRTTRVIVPLDASGAVEQITYYSYRPNGTLQSVSVPDPRFNDTSQVTYTYEFDTLGRPRSIRRPDSTTPSARSGVDLEYDGLTQIAREVVGAAGGQIAETQSIADRFGRVEFIKEKLATGVYATTQYRYGPRDEVSSVIAPDNYEVTMTHDFANQRKTITRGTRTWRYTYDKAGNVIAETTPCQPDPECRPFYTTTTTYDPVNRPYQRAIAPRGLQPADLDLFGAVSEQFAYDYGGHARGRLSQWFAYGASSTERLLQWFNYTPQGQTWQHLQRFTLPGAAAETRRVQRAFHVAGLLKQTMYYEASGGEFPHSRVGYDDRGLPETIEVSLDRGIHWAGGATVQTRNVAGLVTNRRSNVPSGPMSYVESNWTYDELGRVTDQLVQRSISPTQVARQTLTYFGNDDVHTLAHAMQGTSDRTFTYGYDLRHQLLSATEGNASYFDADYTFANTGRLTRATRLARSPPQRERSLVSHATSTTCTARATPSKSPH